MKTADFLFPRDLELTPTNLRSVLLVGSCVATAYQEHFSRVDPGTRFDLIAFNNATDALTDLPQPASAYDFQYVQIPLRSVVSDAMIQAQRLCTLDAIEEFRNNAFARLGLMLDTALQYNRSFGMLTFVQNFIVPEVRVAASLHDAFSIFDLSGVVEDLNRRLGELVRERQNAFTIDVNGTAGVLGKRFFLDDGLAFYSHGGNVAPNQVGAEIHAYWTHPEKGRIEDPPPLDQLYELRLDEFLDAVYRQAISMYRTVRQMDPVKLVIFDLDDTLWRGQIAEHYGGASQAPFVDGWPLGLWEAVHHLRWRGIMTAICSRNDPDIVESRWDLAVRPPFVRLDDFVCREVGWGPKSEAVGRILAALNITARSAVFIDDSPVERESVKAAFPEIRVLGANPYVIRRALLWSAETQVPYLTEESVRRETMLKGQMHRQADSLGVTRDEFLRSLGVKVRLARVGGVEDRALARCVELANKTNQFNTTGARWALEEVRAHLESGGDIYYFAVADKYVDYGLVGVAFVKGSEVSQMAMSCRVIGLDVEVAVIARLAEMIRQGASPVVGRIVKTAANGPSWDAFVRSGFEATGSEGEYTLTDDRELRASHIELLLSDADSSSGPGVAVASAGM